MDMFRIGLFSKVTKITVKTLRYYDEAGLLKPAHIDSSTGYRYYTSKQAVLLHMIVSLRQLDCSIAEISDWLRSGNLRGLLLKKETEIRAKASEMEDKLSRISYILSENREGFMVKYHIGMKELPERIVYYRKGVVASHLGIKDFILEAGRQAKQLNPGIKCVEPGYCFVTYQDGEYKESDISLEYSEAVTEGGKEGMDIKFKTIPGVPAACLYHKGSYSKLPDAYAYILNWTLENGYTVTGDIRESYIDGIWNCDKEEDWLTEIQAPVKKD